MICFILPFRIYKFEMLMEPQYSEKSVLDEDLQAALEISQIRCYSADLSITDISLEEAAAFLSLTRCCPIESQFICGPLAESEVPYAPTSNLRNELLELLQGKGLAAISDQSAEGTIALDGDYIRYEPEKVLWNMPSECCQKLIEQIELAGLSGSWPEHWYSEAQPFWHKIALSECRQFYDHNSNLRGLVVKGDTAVNAMLSNLLRDFSVAQAYRCIWHGARAASDFMARGKVSRIHAANYMVGATQRWADHARAEGWRVDPFRRNFDLPRSMISYVLFDVIFKIGERGFTELIYKESLEW